MLVGVNGFKSAGKDTVGDYLAEQYDFKKVSFAALLKQSAAALFDIEPAKWEEWKNNETMRVRIYSAGMQPAADKRNIVDMSVRAFLQRYGTESHRDVFGYDFWVEQAFKNLDPYAGKYVFTDARFDNELKTIRERGGYNIQVIREETDVESGGHVSEVRPDPALIDAVLHNNGTKEQLYDQVDDFVNGFFGDICA